jgi:hypothetical protein
VGGCEEQPTRKWRYPPRVVVVTRPLRFALSARVSTRDQAPELRLQTQRECAAARGWQPKVTGLRPALACRVWVDTRSVAVAA